MKSAKVKRTDKSPSLAQALARSLLSFWILHSSSLFGAGYHLVTNFTAPLPGRGTVAAEADFEHPKVGLGCARLTYQLDPKRSSATLSLPWEALRIPGPGQLKLWARGDASGDEMQLTFLHAEAFLDDRGERRLKDHQRLSPPRLRLDFDDWRELAFDLSAIPAGRVVWLERLDFHGRRKEGETKPSVVLLDDLRLYPASGSPPATLATCLIGPPARDFARQIALSLDVRSFVAGRIAGNPPAKAKARLTVTDRNQNLVADRDFEVDLAPGDAKELRLELAPDNLEVYLPPFAIDCDVVSADLPQLSQKSEHKLVMANGILVFDDFSDVFGRWFTAGYVGPLDSRSERQWVGWTMGEAQRASPWTQTAARISRAEVPAEERPADPPSPFGRFALRIDYVGDAAVYCGRDRYLPGNPFRFGAWVKGDGSGSKLFALFLDYTDSADFWEGGWKRVYDGERELCTLDFTDWRYVEVPLPGDGLGSNTPRGSTPELDFPLELTAFRIEPPPPKTVVGGPSPAREAKGTQPPVKGSVLIGSIIVHTQQEAATTLAVHVGYDDPERRFDPKLGAWAAVQNASPVRARGVRAAWTLLDRAGDVAGKGVADLKLAPTEMKAFRIDLAKQAPDAATRPGPLRLQVTAAVADDAGVSASREIVLAKPDSAALLTGFESQRGYLGLKAYTLDTAQAAGEPAASTSTDQAHSGKRSLAIAWDKADVPPARSGQPPPRPLVVASIDPALPGIPTEVSLWLFGDGSGPLFYPVIGDTRGVSHGAHGRDFDLFLARAAEGDLQNAVHVDWKGWREVRFRLPAIPPTWDKPQPVLGFVPSYPLGLHLAVDPLDATTDKGTLYVDDIAVTTHLEPDQRLSLTLERPDESNVVPPGGQVEVVAANLDAAAARKTTLAGGVFDWQGRRLGGLDEPLELKPGERRPILVAKSLPAGAYALRVRLADGGRTLAALDEDLLVADLKPVLGQDWLKGLRDEMKLRAPIRDRYTFVDEDWDWVEPYPGNVQLDSLRERAGRVRRGGAAPYMLLGYSAYWAAGVGFEQMKAGAYERRLRDAGHAIDTFLVPERLDDWDHYACEVMRGVGREMAGWVVWNNPDSGPIAVEPEHFARMLASADKWRRLYCPETPLLVGGMSRSSAVPYLQKLAKLGALDHLTGVNVRLDVGRLSPEDARVPAYVRELQAVLRAGAKEPKSVLLTDLDWAVETGDQGLSAFDQAAYLVRSDLLLGSLGIRPALSVRNDDFARLGLGLTYRRELAIPPLVEKPLTLQLKPAWWGILRTRDCLDQLEPAAEVEVQDTIPARTRCLLYKRKADGKAVAAVWRDNDLGHLSFAPTGLPVESAEDAFASTVPAEGGWYAVGKVPVFFVLAATQEPSEQALARLRVRDGAEAEWPQRVLAAFSPSAGQRQKYAQTGGEPATLAGRTATGDDVQWQGLRFPKGGSERFAVTVPKDAALVLRKRFSLGAAGQKAEVLVNGQAAGTWDLRRSAPELSGGLREAIFVVGRKALAGKPEADIEVRYDAAADTAGWVVLEYRGGDFPLSAVGAVHADQNVASPRYGRNIIGGPLAVGQTRFANGIGVFAQSLLEVPLNGQFARFAAKVGVDAVTEGRGSVVFEVYGDGKKLWASPILSGLDEAKAVEADVRGINRLRLVVTDAGDGNKFDAADWCDPVLKREEDNAK